MSARQPGRDELVAAIAATVSDYRNDDGVHIREDDVAAWTDQFERPDRIHVLRETHAILDARYVSKEATAELLDVAVQRLAKEFASSDPKRLLATTAFLDVQAPNKSQGAMLDLLSDVIEPHGFTVVDCGGDSPARYIYLDDVLCTGNRLYQDLRKWWLEEDENGHARQDRLPTDRRVIPVFIALHERNWEKVHWRFRKTPELKERAVPSPAWRALAIQNKVVGGSALDFAFPRRAGLPPEAEAYFEHLGVSPSEVFRPDGMPAKEILFTSPDGRDAFERAVLGKGLEIIGSLATHKENMHPLGYTLPSQKSLGFGALVFTWRNVPNNSPLVFWHDASMWTPLFKKRSDSVMDFSAFFS